MAKTISVDELTYSNVVSLAGKMMMLFERPVSLGFTIYVATLALDINLGKLSPEVLEKVKESFKAMPSPKDWDKTLEDAFKVITGGTS